MSSPVDVVTDRFQLAFAGGQGFTSGSLISTQLFPKSGVISRQGAVLEREAILEDVSAAVDGVISREQTEAELRAALVVLDEETPSGPDFVDGEIIGIDTVGQTITVATSDGQECVDVSAAEIILESPPAEGGADAEEAVGSSAGTITDLEVDQQVSAFGAQARACFAAETLVVTVEPESLRGS